MALLCTASIWWLAAAVARADAPPSNDGGPPTISGVAQQGDVLTASPGGWSGDQPITFSYVWSDGQTGNAITLSSDDVGQSLTVTVTASNDVGEASATSASVGPILPAAPAVEIAPGISGTVQQDRTLSVGPGTWSNNPTAIAYAWQDCGTTGSTCIPISGAISSSYTVASLYVSHYLSVKVTASNSGGATSVFAASVGPVLPPAPANGQPPTISGTGDTLTVSNGAWSNATAYSYAWESCDSGGANCNPIPGATSSSYALSAADIGTTIACVVTASGPGGSTSVTTAATGVVLAQQIPVASQPTTTNLLATPGASVTNQSVTLIATVTAGTSSTALWGSVTFERGGTVIPGCAHMPAVPSGHIATVACSTSFAVSTVQLSAVFTPTSGSILKGSASAAAALTVGPDSSSTTLTAASTVNVGAVATYTAAVAPPASRPGPVQPTGSVEFMDGSTPIGPCANQPMTNGAASCTVSYQFAGAHQISAHYSGDANFSGSTSPAVQVNAVRPARPVLGTISATMQWAFYFTPKYTVVRSLVVNGVSQGARVIARCRGRGCPFASRATTLTKARRCTSKAKRSCLTPGTVNLTTSFAGRHLKVGARITITIVRPNWVGKSYQFTVRPRRAPRVQIGAVAAG